MSFRRNLLKYWDYLFDAASFEPSFDRPTLSQAALQAAASIRGNDYPPALMIHGIMPRSGTVYVGELLRLHPDLHAYPNQIWELPFLQRAEDMAKLEQDFLWAYEQNMGKIGEGDFAALFGAAFVRYLYGWVPEGKRMLLKVPSVAYLSQFFNVFPHEHLLVLIRDGRDVVHSTVKTWPQITFGMACRRWKRSAQMVLACDQRFKAEGRPYFKAQFGHAVRDPETFVKKVCDRFQLDVAKYPFERIGEIGVRGSAALSQEGQVAWAPVEPPKGFNPVGRWQDWPWRRKWLFKRIAGRELMALGYAEDMDW